MRFRAIMLAVCMIAGTGAGAAAAQVCAVTGMEGGDARVQRDGFWFELAAGALPGGAGAIATGPETRLEITCDDGTVVTIGPDSRADLGELIRQPERSVLMRLYDGIMGLVAPPREGRLAVETPVAIASVRSTAWFVEHADGATAVFVREGEVAVGNGVTEVVLRPGEGVTLGASSVIKPVGRWGEARIRQSTEKLGFAWQ